MIIDDTQEENPPPPWALAPHPACRNILEESGREGYGAVSLSLHEDATVGEPDCFHGAGAPAASALRGNILEHNFAGE